MTSRNPCAQCGKTPEEDAPAGLCAACLLEVGLAGGPTEAGRRSRSAPTPEELAGLFPDLEILECIGSGGMGLVYRARQMRLDRIVAVKILSPDLADDAAFAQRFGREARALAQLSHPNIVAIHDFGETGGMYYLVMELVEGTSLRRVMESGSLSPSQALAIVPKLCEALQYAHDRGVVHRDIKPENVLLTKDGQIKVADFGLAKTMQRRHQTTMTAGIIGTPAYMAPEQIEQPHTVDHRADIYSLGVVFYEMLTGELPLGRFAPPSRKVAVDLRLDDVVLRTLEKERELRYQRASDVRTDVDVVVNSPVEPTAGGKAPAGEWKAGTPAAAQPSRPADAKPDPAGIAPARRSRLAWTGLLLSCIGTLFPLLFSAAGALFASGLPGLLTPVGVQLTTLRGLVSTVAIGGLFTLSTLFTLTGVGLGIAGIVAIVRSEGRLRGMPVAVTAVLLPLFVFVATRVLLLGPGWMWS